VIVNPRAGLDIVVGVAGRWGDLARRLGSGMHEAARSVVPRHNKRIWYDGFPGGLKENNIGPIWIWEIGMKLCRVCSESEQIDQIVDTMKWALELGRRLGSSSKASNPRIRASSGLPLSSWVLHWTPSAWFHDH